MLSVIYLTVYWFSAIDLLIAIISNHGVFSYLLHVFYCVAAEMHDVAAVSTVSGS